MGLTYKKTVYGQKSEKTGIVLEGGEQMCIFNEAEENAQSRMWVYCAGKYEKHSNILFEYASTRSGEHAKSFLGGYNKYIVCDGFDAYNKLTDVTCCGLLGSRQTKVR